MNNLRELRDRQILNARIEEMKERNKQRRAGLPNFVAQRYNFTGGDNAVSNSRALSPDRHGAPPFVARWLVRKQLHIAVELRYLRDTFDKMLHR